MNYSESYQLIYPGKPPTTKRFARFRDALAWQGLLWLVAIFIGLGIVIYHETAPTLQSPPPPLWPKNSQILPAAYQPTLLVFAHPHCPCTRASVEELAKIMATCQGKVSAYVVISKPEEIADDWAQSDIWQSAAAIPGVKVLMDNAYLEAQRFHAQSSGLAILYSAQGNLLFSGGITASRGHAGDNFGRSSIVQLLHSGTIDHKNTPVFGCSIFAVNCETTIDKHQKEGSGDAAN